MADLTFKLEGIPESRGSVIDFEGPLTLILQLLNKNRIEIKDVSISVIVDQYMAWLSEMSAMDMEIATEFLTMASHLVYIKARYLLNSEEAQEEMKELVLSLETLKAKDEWEQLKKVTDDLAKMYTQGAGQIPKERTMPESGHTVNLPEDAERLKQVLLEMLAQAGEALKENNTPKAYVPVKITYSVELAGERLLSKLHEKQTVSLTELMSGASGKSEIIAIFLAVLELSSTGELYITGQGADISVSADIPVNIAEEDNGAS